MTSAWLMRGAFALLFGWVIYSSGQTPEDGWVRVEIRDKASGGIVPAMVCITSLADGLWRTPPDGRKSPPFTAVRDFMMPGPWSPGDIGPVRVTNGDYKKNDIRSFSYRGDSDYPFWREPAAYFVSQPFSIRLAPGRWRLAVARGIEFLPVFEEFEVHPGEALSRKVTLSRWVDMPRQGWYSGDDHVHFPRLTPAHDQFLLTWARAEDIHVANILRMGDVHRTNFEQNGYGVDHQYGQGAYVLVSGQEDPRSPLGHTIALNLKAPVRDVPKYHLYDSMFAGARQQGAVTGYAHLAWSSPWDATINTLSRQVDFFEILQFRQLGLADYYDFLNMGIPLSASAGSDLPWGNTIGETRVYAYTGRSFSAAAWFDALKKGRTFVTNGPMLLLTAGSAIPGDTVKARKGAMVHLRARAWAPQEMGAPKILEIVSQGRVIRSTESKDPGGRDLHIDFKLPVTGSAWFAARTITQNGGLAHTSPIYLIADGEPILNRADLPDLTGRQLRVLDHIAAQLKDPKFVQDFAPGEVAELMKLISESRDRYGALSPERR